MPRVVPSQVCAFIDSLPDYKLAGNLASMNELGSGSLNAILDLISQIPEELLTMNSATYSAFIHAKAYMRDVVQTWMANRNAGIQPMAFHRPATRDLVALIRRALSQCPDDAPAPATSELNFITDSDLRACNKTSTGTGRG